MTVPLPPVIGGWTLVKLMGEGAQGQVWKVHRPTATGGSVVRVMKLPLADGVANPDAGHRWLSEAKILVKVQNCGHVVKVHDAGVDRGIYYLLIEYVHGADLGKLLRLLRKVPRPTPVAAAVWIAGQVMLGLSEIHGLAIANVQQKIVHKDVAPKNILLSSDGEVKLGDFGVATARDVKLKNSGTLRYMAPEHLHGYPSPASDVFSGAVTLWESLEMVPYRSNDQEIAMHEIMATSPRPLSRPGVPASVRDLLACALDPLERNRPTAMEFVEALEVSGAYVPCERVVGGLVKTYAHGGGTSGQTEVFDGREVTRTPNLAGLLDDRDQKLAHTALPTDEMLALARARAEGRDVDGSAARVASPPAPPPEGIAILLAELVAVSPMPLPSEPGAQTVALPGDAREPDAPTPRYVSGYTAIDLEEPVEPSRTGAVPRELRGVPRSGPGRISVTPPVVLPPLPPVPSSPSPSPAVGDAAITDTRHADWTPPSAAVVDLTVPVTAPSTPTERAARQRDRVRLRGMIGLALGSVVLAVGGGWMLLESLTPDRVAPLERTLGALAVRQDRPVARPAPASDEVRSGPRLVPVPAAAPARVEPVASPPTGTTDAPSPASLEPSVVPTAGPATPAPAPEPSPTVSPAAPSAPKRPAPALPKVDVMIYREFIDGLDLKIGRRRFDITSDVAVTIVSGKHPVEWREHGTTVWRDAGVIDFVAHRRHTLRFGATGKNGFQYRMLGGTP